MTLPFSHLPAPFSVPKHPGNLPVGHLARAPSETADMIFRAPVRISSVIIRCDYYIIGWFEIGSHQLYLFLSSALVRRSHQVSKWFIAFDCVRGHITDLVMG